MSGACHLRSASTYSGLVLEDPNAGSVAGHEFDLAADGQRGERAGVSKVDIGHDWQSDEWLLTVEDLLEEIAAHAAGLLEAAEVTRPLRARMALWRAVMSE
jgi:hypothetical protein